jgi:probable HAF family extracellular repeat protein
MHINSKSKFLAIKRRMNRIITQAHLGPLLLLFCSLSISHASTVLYSVIALPQIPGDTSSHAQYVNDLGQAVGASYNRAANRSVATIWENGIVTQLPGFAVARDINNSGKVIGETRNGSLRLWDRVSGTQSIGSLSGYGYHVGVSINNSNSVVGFAQGSSSSNGTGFIWDAANGIKKTGKPSGYSGSSASSVNDSGMIVGTAYSSPDSYSAYSINTISGIQILPVLPGYSMTTATEINELDQIVGRAMISSGEEHAVLWDEVGMHDLGTLSGDTYALATCINNNGQVVGYSAGYSDERAFLWQSDRGMNDLNSLIDPASGWSLNRALGINDSGQIVGDGTFNGQEIAFILTPVPEPSPFALCAGAFGIFCSTWRRRRFDSGQFR